MMILNYELRSHCALQTVFGSITLAFIFQRIPLLGQAIR